MNKIRLCNSFFGLFQLRVFLIGIHLHFNSVLLYKKGQKAAFLLKRSLAVFGFNLSTSVLFWPSFSNLAKSCLFSHRVIQMFVKKILFSRSHKNAKHKVYEVTFCSKMYFRDKFIINTKSTD